MSEDTVHGFSAANAEAVNAKNASAQEGERKPAGQGKPLPEATFAHTTQENEAWNIARSMIQHEDTLIHHRMTHFLSIQAFLFGAAGVSAQQGFKHEAPLIFWPSVILAIGGMALWISKLAKDSIYAAITQIMLTRNWWSRNSRDRDHYVHDLPGPTSKSKTPRGTGNYGHLAGNLDETSWKGFYPSIIGHVTLGSGFTEMTRAFQYVWGAFILADLGAIVYLIAFY